MIGFQCFRFFIFFEFSRRWWIVTSIHSVYWCERRTYLLPPYSWTSACRFYCVLQYSWEFKSGGGADSERLLFSMLISRLRLQIYIFSALKRQFRFSSLVFSWRVGPSMCGLVLMRSGKLSVFEFSVFVSKWAKLRFLSLWKYFLTLISNFCFGHFSTFTRHQKRLEYLFRTSFSRQL